jgi:cytoskeletal protein CcmA (bactofilin family)
MKLPVLSLSIASLLTITAAHADMASYYGVSKFEKASLEPIAIYGPAKLHEVRAEALNLTGTLEFTDLEVAKDTKIIGPVTGKKGKFDSLEVHGPLKFESIEVSGNAEINGPVHGRNGKFSKLTVNGPIKATHISCEAFHAIGPVKVENLSVKGDTVVVGSLETKDSRLSKLIVTADKTVLESTTVEDIWIKDNQAKDQTVVLKLKSTVKGDITFESGNGIVLLGKGAQIVGNVKGGKIENRW